MEINHLKGVSMHPRGLSIVCPVYWVSTDFQILATYKNNP